MVSVTDRRMITFPETKKAPSRPLSESRGRLVPRAGRYSGSYPMGQSWSARINLSAEASLSFTRPDRRSPHIIYDESTAARPQLRALAAVVGDHLGED